MCGHTFGCLRGYIWQLMGKATYPKCLAIHLGDSHIMRNVAFLLNSSKGNSLPD